MKHARGIIFAFIIATGIGATSSLRAAVMGVVAGGGYGMTNKEYSMNMNATENEESRNQTYEQKKAIANSNSKCGDGARHRAALGEATSIRAYIDAHRNPMCPCG